MDDDNVFLTDSKKFTLSDYMNSHEEGRSNLGDQIPVVVYRLLEYSLREQLEECFGNEKQIEIFRKAGYQAGEYFAANFLNLEIPFSEFIAQEMLVKLQLLGKNCIMSSDPNIIVTMSKRIKREDLVIIITLNGETKELVTGAKNAFENRVSTLTITTNEESSISKYSEMTLLGFKSQTSYFPDYEVRSRLPLQVISRILLDSYVIRTQSKNN